jgi:DNA helicase-2/ATP-dependent DNA helicase PcrA
MESPQSEDLLQGLNDAQKTAVQAPPGPMIVLAGPGSGKTRVLTSRIAFLIMHGAAPGSIVAVTFTNKAANEMRKRIKNVLGIKHDSELHVTVGTFHRVCLDILREYGYLDGLEPNFLIFDADQQKQLVVQAMEELGISTEAVQPNTIRFAISNLKSQNLVPERAAEFINRDGAVWNPKFIKTVQRVYECYQQELQRSNAVDFDDILLFTLRLLQGHPEVTAQLQHRWHHLLVDEWQDTNVPQYSLISLLAAASGGRATPSVFVVGDADQSIYGWRGADFTNVGRFEKDFSAHRILLQHNYRSTSTIVEASRISKKQQHVYPCEYCHI